jgi:hypothetical protein
MKVQVEGASGTKGKTNIDVSKMTSEQLKRAIEEGKVSP